MNKDGKQHDFAPEDRRDAAADKKKIKKIALIVLSAFLVLAAIYGALLAVDDLLEPEYSEASYEDYRFYEADYSKNILEDKLYLSLNRNIYFERMGSESVLTKENAIGISLAADLFFDYFDCLVKGDYENYSSFFTQECLESKNFTLPERFTMQGIYDVHINMYRSDVVDEESDTVREIYEVSYRIFENNGTFRSDILPDETRTLVFEINITKGVAKINAIGHRANG
jgi:hypothetical protein